MKFSARRLSAILAALGMLVLILDFKTAILGASQGLELCIRTVIPSLFPFFVLSGLLTGTLLGANIPMLYPLGKLCGIPKGAESLLVVGLLGGYPVGAQCVAQACKSGQLNKRDAMRMLGFCSNAGPAFLFGMAGVLFPNSIYPLLLFLIQILSAVTVGILLPGKHSSTSSSVKPSKISLTDSLKNAIFAIAGVCGWIVLFRVILVFCQRWFLWLLPPVMQVAFTGLCELSNGILSLVSIQSIPLRFVLCASMLSLGGICVAMQTVSVTSGLGLGAYLPGKVLQCCISTLLAFSTAAFLWKPSLRIIAIFIVLLLAFMPICVSKLGKREKNSSIQKTIRV